MHRSLFTLLGFAAAILIAQPAAAGSKSPDEQPAPEAQAQSPATDAAKAPCSGKKDKMMGKGKGMKPCHNFDGLDADGDGSVSQDEFIAGHREMLEAKFAKIDADGDGSLSEAEIEENCECKKGKGRKHKRGMGKGGMQ